MRHALERVGICSRLQRCQGLLLDTSEFLQHFTLLVENKKRPQLQGQSRGRILCGTTLLGLDKMRPSLRRRRMSGTDYPRNGGHPERPTRRAERDFSRQLQSELGKINPRGLSVNDPLSLKGRRSSPTLSITAFTLGTI